MPIRCIIDNLVECQNIFQQLYNQSRYKRQKSIYRQIANRY